MNVIFIFVRRFLVWQDDKQYFVYNLVRISKFVIFEIFEIENVESFWKKEKCVRINELFGKLKQIVVNKKYRDVDWYCIVINVGGIKFFVYNGIIRIVLGI